MAVHAMAMYPDQRMQIVREARLWLGTPYQHQASCQGAGTDCLGLLRGIWRRLYGEEPEMPPPYTPDWAERQGCETLLEAARRWLIPVAQSQAQHGDVLLFRMCPAGPCKHIAIMSALDTMIHAYWGRGVTESHLVPYWQRRWAFTFAFPAISPKSVL